MPSPMSIGGSHVMLIMDDEIEIGCRESGWPGSPMVGSTAYQCKTQSDYLFTYRNQIIQLCCADVTAT